MIQEMESLDSLKPFDVMDTLREIQEAPPKGARGKKDITPKWKHYGLKTFLASCTSASITLSFREIEKLDGLPLAASAYKNKDWWYPRQNCNTIAEAWLTEGYYLSNVGFQKQKVTLHRDEDGMAKPDIPRALTDGKIPENAKYELETHMSYIIKKYGL